MTTSPARKRPGRPAGISGTRERILASAREMFARNGITNTSIRAIAAAAGVDSALVHHYFGTKEKLFAAAIRLPVDPAVVLRPLREAPVDQIGHLLPRLLLSLWDSELGANFVAVLRSMLSGSDTDMARAFLQDVISAEIGPRVDQPAGSGRIRVQFAATQMLGVAVARYILQLEPFTSLPADQIADTVGPTVQRYLTAELPGFS